MLADDDALVLDHGNIRPILLMPLLPGIDIPNFNREAPIEQRQQFLDQDLAQVAAVSAVNRDAIHSACVQARRHQRRALLQATLSAQPETHDRGANRGAGDGRQDCHRVACTEPPGIGGADKGAG